MGAPLAWVRGVRCRALSHPRPLVLSGVRPGRTTHWLWMRGVQAWGPVTNSAAGALASWLCALWGRHEGAQGGRLLPGCGASGIGSSPSPDHSSFRACGRGPLPTCCGCGGVQAWGPVTNSTAGALASWLCALTGRHEGAQGGRLLPGCGASGVGRSPSPDHSSFRACGRGPPPTCCGCGGCRRGDPSPNPAARALASWLCALLGRHEGARGGAPPAWVSGVRGPAVSHPRPLVLSGVRPGPTTHWPWVREVRAWGPVTNPTVRAIAGWLCALWGRHEGARGGRLLAGCGASGVGPSPTPNLSSFQACGRGP